MNLPDVSTPTDPVQPGLHSCGVLLFRAVTSGWQFLLLRHQDRWDLPKGLQEPGESPLEAAFRELWEETSISREQVQLVPDFEFNNVYPVIGFDGQPTWKQLSIFLGTIEGDPPIVLTEHLAYQWFDWQPPHQIESKNVDAVLAAVAALPLDQWIGRV